MYFFVKKLSINESLDSQKYNVFTNYLGRYNAVADLASKSSQQRKLFLSRVQQLFNQKLENSSFQASSSLNRTKDIKNYTDTSLDLSLMTVFCQSQQDFSLESFPLYDFVSFDINRDESGLKTGYGVMYSAYTHDLDRALIERQQNSPESMEFSSLLMRSLFLPTCLNNGQPPLAEKYPIFVFPQDTETVGMPSSTNMYMESLDFQVSIQQDLEGLPLRLFSHREDVQAFEDPEIMAAIMAIGQVMLEIIYPHLYHSSRSEIFSSQRRFLPRSSLEAFNRNNFTDTIKENQSKIIKRWLKKNSDKFPKKSNFFYYL